MSNLDTLVRSCMLVFLTLAAVACGTGSSSDPGMESSTNTNPETSAETSNIERTITVTSPNAEILFPRQKSGLDSMMSLVRGKLILDDKGCIRVRDADDESVQDSSALVWPADFDLSVSSDDVRVIDGKDRTVAQVGAKVFIGGGGISGKLLEDNKLIDEETLSELFERCPGSYWLVATGDSVGIPQRN